MIPIGLLEHVPCNTAKCSNRNPKTTVKAAANTIMILAQCHPSPHSLYRLGCNHVWSRLWDLARPYCVLIMQMGIRDIGMYMF